MLYCPVCKVAAYRNHRCSPSVLVPIKGIELRAVVDQLFRLDIPVLSASWFSFPVEGSYYEHRITASIELQNTYSTDILDLPDGWKWFTETVTDDHLPLSCLGYSEMFVWLGDVNVEARVRQIINEFVEFLSNIDKEALKAIMLLSG